MHRPPQKPHKPHEPFDADSGLTAEQKRQNRKIRKDAGEAEKVRVEMLAQRHEADRLLPAQSRCDTNQCISRAAAGPRAAAERVRVRAPGQSPHLSPGAKGIGNELHTER